MTEGFFWGGGKLHTSDWLSITVIFHFWSCVWHLSVCVAVVLARGQHQTSHLTPSPTTEPGWLRGLDAGTTPPPLVIVRRDAPLDVILECAFFVDDCLHDNKHQPGTELNHASRRVSLPAPPGASGKTTQQCLSRSEEIELRTYHEE